MDELGNALRSDDDQHFWRHQNRWLALSAVGGAILASGVVVLIDGHITSGATLVLLSLVSIWYSDRCIMTAPSQGVGKIVRSHWSPVIACLMGAVVVFLGYDIYVRRMAPTPMSPSEAHQRDIPDQQFTNLVNALKGYPASISIGVQPKDPEAMTYAVKLATIFRRAQWKVADGDPQEYKPTPKLGEPGLVVNYHEGDPRWRLLLEKACAEGIQIKGYAFGVDAPKGTDMTVWVGEIPK